MPPNSTFQTAWSPVGFPPGRSRNPNSSSLFLPEVDHQTDHQTEGLQRSDPDALARDTPLDLRKWTSPDSVRPARWDWKSCDLQGSVGSNPTSSALS